VEAKEIVDNMFKEVAIYNIYYDLALLGILDKEEDLDATKETM